jgi:Rod binding domain-containing protein
MKIKPVHTDDPLGRSKRSSGLKPLAGEDFHGTLAALAPAAPAQPTATVAPSADSLVVPELRPLSADQMIRGFKGQPKPLEPLAPAAAPPLVPLADSDEDFAPGLPQRNTHDQHDKVVETARKLVAQTFYGTLLKQMRESPFKSELFEGGRGGQAFSPLLDQHLAEHMTRATDNHLVRAIARKLEGKAAYQQQQLSAAKRAARPTPNARTMNVATSLRA